MANEQGSLDYRIIVEHAEDYTSLGQYRDVEGGKIVFSGWQHRCI